MAISFLDENISVPIRPAAALGTSYSHFRLNGPESDPDTINDVEGTLDPFTPNTTPDFTTHPGWLTCETGDGGSGQERDASTTEKTFLNTHTCAGSIWVTAWVQPPDTVSVADVIFQYGSTNGAKVDVYKLTLTSARKMSMNYNNANTPTGSSATLGAGTRHFVAGVIDFVNLKLSTYVDGILDTTLTAFTKLVAEPVIPRVGMLCAPNNVIGVATHGQFEMAEGDTVSSNDALVRDIRIFRFENDYSAQFADALLALKNTPPDRIPRMMEGWS